MSLGMPRHGRGQALRSRPGRPHRIARRNTTPTRRPAQVVGAPGPSCPHAEDARRLRGTPPRLRPTRPSTPRPPPRGTGASALRSTVYGRGRASLFHVERGVAVFQGETRLPSCFGGVRGGHEHERVAGVVFHAGHGQDRLDGKGQHIAGLDREQAGRFQQADREVEIVGVDRVGERGEDVLAVGGHAGAPLDLLRPPQSFAATKAYSA